MKRAIFLFLILSSLSPVFGATVTASSQSKTDIAAALALCSTGDTLQLAAGTATGFTTPLSFDVENLIIKGADNHASIFPDDLTSDTGMFDLDADGIRLTGVRFEDGSRASVYFGGIVNTGGGYGGFVIDNCVFDTTYNRQILWYGNAGLVCHNTFTPNGQQVAYIKHANWDTLGSDNGDSSWADDFVWGSANAVFWEDNTLTQADTDPTTLLDADRGSRVVVRYSTLYGHITVHGTESSQPQRGGHAYEVYECVFGGNNAGKVAFELRSGSLRFHNNNLLSDEEYPAIVRATDYRTMDTFGFWGGATGVNGFDQNDDASNPYATGTALSGGTLTMTVSGTPWTNNQFVEAGSIFILRNLTSGEHCMIVSNTTNTITFRNPFSGSAMSFSASDSFEINKILTTLDQPGYIGGDMLNRSTPAWPNQVSSPVYVWDNTYDDGTVININDHASNDSYHHIEKGVDIIFSDPVYTTYIYPHPDNPGVNGAGGGSSGPLKSDSTGRAKATLKTDDTGRVKVQLN